jgi:hypothetical protein
MGKYDQSYVKMIAHIGPEGTVVEFSGDLKEVCRLVAGYNATMPYLRGTRLLTPKMLQQAWYDRWVSCKVSPNSPYKRRWHIGAP